MGRDTLAPAPAAEKQTPVKPEQQAKAPTSVAGRGPKIKKPHACIGFSQFLTASSLSFFFNDSSSTSFSYNIYISIFIYFVPPQDQWSIYSSCFLAAAAAADCLIACVNLF